MERDENHQTTQFRKLCDEIGSSKKDIFHWYPQSFLKKLTSIKTLDQFGMMLQRHKKTRSEAKKDHQAPSLENSAMKLDHQRRIYSIGNPQSVFRKKLISNTTSDRLGMMLQHHKISILAEKLNHLVLKNWV